GLFLLHRKGVGSWLSKSQVTKRLRLRFASLNSVVCRHRELVAIVQTTNVTDMSIFCFLRGQREGVVGRRIRTGHLLGYLDLVVCILAYRSRIRIVFVNETEGRSSIALS